jgi:hypothetical protein
VCGLVCAYLANCGTVRMGGGGGDLSFMPPFTSPDEPTLALLAGLSNYAASANAMTAFGVQNRSAGVRVAHSSVVRYSMVSFCVAGRFRENIHKMKITDIQHVRS